MRKVEELMLDAIIAKRRYRGRNTEVRIERFGASFKVRVYLHGNCIATIAQNYIEFCDCGYTTRTTYSRINAMARRFLNITFSYARNAPHANGIYEANVWANTTASSISTTSSTTTTATRRAAPARQSNDFIAGFA